MVDVIVGHFRADDGSDLNPLFLVGDASYRILHHLFVGDGCDPLALMDGGY